ncbi:hypothetical protein [Sphingobacterium lactis]|uniref:hypothetical protein n=1 Tax=Sphingobacterium lactis TaxID=797291 RepID=UPI003DA6AF86
MATLKNSWLRASIALMVLLFGVFMVVKAMGGNEKNSTESNPKNIPSVIMVNWEFTPNVSSDPLEPENYIESSTSHCSGTKEVCGIKAPADANGYPVITPGSGLATRIQNKDKTGGDVFLKGT